MPKNQTTIALGTMVILVAAVTAISQYAGPDLDLSWYTIDGGGAMFSTGGDLELSGTIGQHDAGVAMTGGDLELSGGFWPGVSTGAVFGDCDGDGDVDLFDWSTAVGCFSGSGTPADPGCECVDSDSDTDVDVVDWGAVQVSFTG